MVRLPLSPTHARANAASPLSVLNVAHRGASSEVAENTLAAIRRALACDADVVELDIQRTRDGELVLIHDTSLVRTTDARRVFPNRAPWRIADFNYDELQRLDAGSWKSGISTGVRIPTLSEAIEVVRQSRAGLLLELKAPERYPGIVPDLITELHRARAFSIPAARLGRLGVQSFNFAAMKEHKARAPEIPVGLLGTPPTGNLPALGTWADQVNSNHYTVDRTYVDEVHRHGMACLVWTVNRRSGLRRALGMGVDGVITNRPHTLARLLVDPCNANQAPTDPVMT